MYMRLVTANECFIAFLVDSTPQFMLKVALAGSKLRLRRILAKLAILIKNLQSGF